MTILLHAGGSVASAVADMAEVLSLRTHAILVPFALRQQDEAVARWAAFLQPHGVTVTGLHNCADPVAAIETTEAILMGGGNTFRLLQGLQKGGIAQAIWRRVADGVPYIGASAGSNVAGPSIRTTNDMPIVELRSFKALGLVPFQINPHFLDAPPGPSVGETRAERLEQFLEENDAAVLGLREESWLYIDGGKAELRGSGGAVLFRRDIPATEFAAGADLSFLLALRPQFDTV